MKLRTGLALQLVALLAVALGFLGVFVERQTRTGLVSQVDERLEGSIVQRLRNVGRDRPAADATARARDGYPATATVLIDPAGTITDRRPSGIDDVADPLPAVTSAWASEHVGRNATIEAVSSSLRYRARAARTPDGGLLVEAAPLRSADASVARLRRTLVLGALGVLLAAALALSRLVARSLHPLSQIAASAAVVAAGDLHGRVAVPSRYSELQQLGSALDHMVHELTTAIGERTQALEVEAASRLRLRRFAADASHELQTPVTSIRGWAELYRMGGLSEKSALDPAMHRIEREAARMGRLVDDLLLLARAEEQRPLVRAPVDLMDICHDAVAAAGAIDPTRTVAIAAPATPDAGSAFVVAGDADRLRQVVDNLLANVRAHTDPGTSCRIDIGCAGNEAVLAVCDDGPGFPDDALDQVFDRFWRSAERSDLGPSRGTTRPRGHGLGLAIVQAIVALHGGSVSAANVAPHGARITVRLPLRIPHGQTPTSAETPT